MRFAERPRMLAAAALAAALLGALALLWLEATRADGVPFFPREAPAEWILYPLAPNTFVRSQLELEALFTRELTLPAAPQSARLRVRLHRAGRVLVNGAPVAFAASSGERWKEAREGDVAALLHAGSNRVEVHASARFGPPALWLVLDAGAERLVSDASWTVSLMGAEETPARLAREPMSRWARTQARGAELDAQNPRPLDALRARLPTLVGLFALAGAVALAVARGLLGTRRLSPRVTLGAWLAAAAVWIALFAHNRALRPSWGFDSHAHADYVAFLLQHGSVPLADQGWQMYQPPLYYVLAAGVARLAGFASVEPEAVEALRWLGCVAALLQSGFLLLALRELLPERPGLVLCAFVFGAFLPLQLYLFQFVTNETWVAALVTGALWWTIRMLRHPAADLRQHAILGVFLGLAMLAKFSALIPLVLCPAVLLVQRWLAGRTPARGLLARLAVTLGVVLLLCGWHYLRVALHFGGNPFVGNWDAASGFSWWQDPGYHVRDDYLRFGLALERPLLSAFASVPDALYSTLFGDGLLSGSGFAHITPPWDLSLMAAGYLVALGPCLALLLGVVLAGADFVRTPRAERGLALALLGATGFALLSLTLRLPFYAQAKAFYGASALAPLALCFAFGFDALALRRRWLAPLGVAWLAGWAALALASFFAPAERLAQDPTQLSGVVDREGWIARANAALAGGRSEEGIEALRHALVLDPDQARVGPVLAQLLVRAGRSDEALAAARAAVRVTPTEPSLHALLAELWRAQGDAERAAFHRAAARSVLPPRARSARDR